MNLYKVRSEGGSDVDPPHVFYFIASDADQVVWLWKNLEPRWRTVPIASIEKIFATKIVVAKDTSVEPGSIVMKGPDER